MSNKSVPSIRSSAAEYLTFVAATGDDKNSVEVRYEDENIWITQKMLAVLYEVETNTINYHIKKIFEDSELQEDSTIRKFRIVQNEGSRQVSRDVDHYNLQMIIAVGFAENMANRHIPLTMEDWEKRLNGFIEMFEYGLLLDAGKVTAEIAKLHAETEFEKYRIVQDRLFMSDYDRFIEELEQKVK